MSATGRLAMVSFGAGLYVPFTASQYGFPFLPLWKQIVLPPQYMVHSVSCLRFVRDRLFADGVRHVRGPCKNYEDACNGLSSVSAIVP